MFVVEYLLIGKGKKSMIHRQQKNENNTKNVSSQKSVKSAVPTVFSYRYMKALECLSQEETLDYKKVLENYSNSSIKILLFFAKNLELDRLVNVLEKANVCIDVIHAHDSNSINLLKKLADFGEEDFYFLIQKASVNGNDNLTRALQHAQLIARANRVSHYRQIFASSKEEALNYLESLSIITLVNLADDLEMSLNHALYRENRAYTPEYALIVAKINEFAKAEMPERTNVKYDVFFTKKILQYSTAG